MRQILQNWLFLAVLYVGSCCLKAQCPPTNNGYLQFNSQAEINNFIINYPNCTSIEGKLVIGTNFGSQNDITDLSAFRNVVSTKGLLIQNTKATSLEGLNAVSAVTNTELAIRYNELLTDITALSNVTEAPALSISQNNSLTSLQGLHNIQTVTEYVEILQHAQLPNLHGLDNLTSIRGHLQIRLNNGLTSLSGLDNLEKTGGLKIQSNNSLTSLEGINGLTEMDFIDSDNSSLVIAYNPLLTSIEALDNLTNIGGMSIDISSNASLSSLSGIGNINPETINGLWLLSSQQLSLCNVPSICEYLSNGGSADISENAVGCNSVAEVQLFCDGFSDCPEGNVSLLTQADIDAFSAQYPTCTTILGNLFIGTESGISDISDLSGLLNITNVTGFVSVTNTSLNDLNGLNALAAIGGDLVISGNAELQNIQALSALTGIGFSQIIIQNNNSLTSLSGLDNINPASISNLILQSSQHLSTCDVESICTYISTFDSQYTISGNAEGCNSFDEVLDACQDILPECPAESVIFTSQADLDHFAIQYPNCTQISGILKIGDVGENDISDLSPLNKIQTVTMFIDITHTALENLDGLNNLESVLYISFTQNNSLKSLDGLESLNNTLSITIYENPDLESIESLSGITQTGEIMIYNNDSLTDLTGLNNLTTCEIIGITSNDALVSLEGLNNLTTVNGELSLHNNSSLQTLEALSNLKRITGTAEIGPGGKLWIQENPLLTDLTGLNNLEIVQKIQISNNEGLTSLSGLENVTVIDGKSVNTSNYLQISGNNSLTSLNGLHNLTSLGYYDAASETNSGDLEISNNPALENLSELNALTKVYSGLTVNSNENLESLEGLENLSIIGGSLIIGENDRMNSLNGLNNLSKMGLYSNFYQIIWIYDNPLLSNLTALSNLQTMDDSSIWIEGNPVLTSLQGLHNIAPASVGYFVKLNNNSLLAECSISPVCNWFVIGGGEFDIVDGNANGCSSTEEILELCELSIEEISDFDEITFYPVPAKEILNIHTKNEAVIKSVTIYDMNGKLIYQSFENNPKINISHFTTGTYLVSVKTSKGVYNEKIIKK